jgi:sensor histidine kinase YesM
MPIGCFSRAQQPIIFNGQPNLKIPVDISAHTSFYEDTSGDTLSFEAIKKQRFIPLSMELMQRRTARRPLIVNWLKFSIKNISPTDTLRLIFTSNTHVFIRLFSDEQQVNRSFSFEQIKTDSIGMRLTIIPDKTNTYYVRVIDYVHYLAPLSAELHTPITHLQFYQRNSINSAYLFMVMCASLGCLFFMGIYAGYQFLLTRDKAIGYYTAYVLCAVFAWLLLLDSRFSLDIWNSTKYNYDTPLNSGIVIFYALFITSMLDTAHAFPKQWKLFQLMLGLILIQMLLVLVDDMRHRFTFSSNTYYLYIQVIPTIIMDFYLIYLIIISKSPLKKYLLAGILSLFVFLFLLTNFSYFIFIEIHSPKLKMFGNFPPLFGMLGVVVEAICFAFALAYRSKLVQDEKNNLQTSYAGRLEQELSQRILEIQKQNDLLEAQKIQQIEMIFEKKLAETEMTALRAQMNPHFIFNCLNSIKLYMLENDSETASAYLTTFSRLIRLVLENSRSEKVTLENEIETLHLYIELEVMRFKDKVSYQINIDSKIDTAYIELPPLLLQPYVENAIWHGLMHKEFGGKVNIDISQPEEHLLHVEITDDGVGREKAAEYKSKSILKHKSFGLKMTKERIQVINQLYNIKTEARIIDLVDNEGLPCGTKVIICIPFNT